MKAMSFNDVAIIFVDAKHYTTEYILMFMISGSPKLQTHIANANLKESVIFVICKMVFVQKN